MDTGRFLENARKVSILIVVCFLVPFFAYYTSRTIIRYSTGVAFGKNLHNTSEMRYKATQIDEELTKIRERLKRGMLSPEEQYRIELQKRELEKKLKKVSVEERKKLDLKKQKLTQEYMLLEKESSKLEAQNKEMDRKHKLIFFLILSIIGFVFLVLGYITKLGYLGAGFIIGGVLCIIVGFTVYWDQLNDLLKLGVLALSVGAVIVFAYGLARRE